MIDRFAAALYQFGDRCRIFQDRCGATAVVQEMQRGVHSQGMIDRGVNVMRAKWPAGGSVTVLVGRADDLTAFDASTSEQTEHRVAPVISAWRSFVVTVVHAWCATELATQYHQSGIEHAAIVQVIQQTGHGIVNARQKILHARLKTPMMIPAAKMHRYEPRSGLDDSSRQ